MKFLTAIKDYFESKNTSDEKLKEIIKEINETDGYKDFATDQLLKFSKAINIASLFQAGAKKVQWLTVGDQRVRATHKKLHGKIFNINRLPDECYDENCRCTVIAVFD